LGCAPGPRVGSPAVGGRSSKGAWCVKLTCLWCSTRPALCLKLRLSTAPFVRLDHRCRAYAVQSTGPGERWLSPPCARVCGCLPQLLGLQVGAHEMLGGFGTTTTSPHLLPTAVLLPICTHRTAPTRLVDEACRALSPQPSPLPSTCTPNHRSHLSPACRWACLLPGGQGAWATAG